MARKRLMMVFLLAGIVAGFAFTAVAGNENVPRMAKEELKAKIGNPDLIVLDVRTGKDWDASEFKIKGALREDSAKIDGWKDKYSKEKTIVLYCA